MFNQVLKQLWNARRSNAWIWAVLLVVSVLLWFALDIIYNYEAAARKPLGYDVDGLYNIELRYNWTTNADSTQDEDNRAIYNLIKAIRWSTRYAITGATSRSVTTACMRDSRPTAIQRSRCQPL